MDDEQRSPLIEYSFFYCQRFDADRPELEKVRTCNMREWSKEAFSRLTITCTCSRSVSNLHRSNPEEMSSGQYLHLYSQLTCPSR